MHHEGTKDTKDTKDTKESRSSGDLRGGAHAE